MVLRVIAASMREDGRMAVGLADLVKAIPALLSKIAKEKEHQRIRREKRRKKLRKERMK